jgi:hypothetical protein
MVGYSIGAPKYRSTIANYFRIWKRCVAVVVAVLFLQEQDHLRLRDYHGGKKGQHVGHGQLDYKARRISVRGREGRKKGKGSAFLRTADNFFRILRSCPLRVHIFLLQHLPEIPLLENVRFTMFSVTITNICIRSAKPWQQQI